MAKPLIIEETSGGPLERVSDKFSQAGITT